MVKLLDFAKSEHFLAKNLAIALVVVAFLFPAGFASAAKMKISEQEAERIKTALDIVGTASNIGGILVDGGNLKTVLNTVISGGQTATDITYGLLVLSAINEMEFMDMVLSQSYKDEARGYFNRILDERTDLRSYWKGVGFDIPKVVGGRITSSASALTLNTFEITDKTIQIMTEFSVLQKERQYDGLWYYFDFRRGGDSHEEAWELVEEQMGWAARPSFAFRGVRDVKNNDNLELEQQFLTLYDKWGPYATAYGISKEYKEQLASELRTTLASAIEENTGVQPMYVEGRTLWEKLAAQLASIKDAIASIASQVNPFKAGPVVELPEQVPTELPVELPIEIQEMMDIGYPSLATTTEPEVVSEIKPEPEIEQPATTTEPNQESAEVELPPALPPATEPEPEPEPEVSSEPIKIITGGPQLCQKGAGGAARQYRVLISEVAWMGDQDSPNNEWIELKNVWGIPVSLAGWQMQDKDQQIKIIFEENDAIPAQEYLVLKRSKDYTGALNNSDEALYLFDNNCQLEDEIIASPDWPGGDNASKKPMQRFDTLYWYTGVATAGAENGSPPAVLAHPSAPAPSPAPAKPTYQKIIITESRLGSPGNQKDDFVEIYNPNSEAVGLTDWYIQRKTETGSDFSSYAPAGLFLNKTIGANGYFLIANASTTLSAELVDATTTYPLTENNTLALKSPDQEIVDQVSTDNPANNQSFSRKWSSSTVSYLDTDSASDFEVQDPTPRVQNQSSAEGGGGGGDEGGAQPLSVVINEIAWAGTAADSRDEWIELYNNATSSVNLADWKIKKGYADWVIFTTSTIPAQGYYLLERQSDETVNSTSADLIYGNNGSSWALNNNGEVLELRDNLDNLIDSLDASANWPAGQASPNYISMERISSTSTATSTNWAANNIITRSGLDADSNPINGTPKAQNSVSKSSTEINNGIVFDADITLTRLGSPYIINSGTLEVEPSVVLTVESGTTIKFNSGTRMLVGGTLLAQGVATSTVVFTSITDSDPENNGGYYIYFEPTSVNSVLENIVVRYGGFYVNDVVGYKAALSIEDALLTLTDSVIENNFFAGVYLMNSTSTIRDTIFRDNKVKYSDLGVGSYSRGFSIYNSDTNLSGLYFERNYHGVYVEGDCPDLSDATFGADADINTFDVSPEICLP